MALEPVDAERYPLRLTHGAVRRQIIGLTPSRPEYPFEAAASDLAGMFAVDARVRMLADAVGT